MNRMVMNLAKSPIMYVFPLQLKARDHTSFNFKSHLYSLRMRFKRPHTVMVMALTEMMVYLNNSLKMRDKDGHDTV